jgi:hypothetical protein
MNADTLIAIVGVLAMVFFGTWSALRGRFFARKRTLGLPRHRIPDVAQEDVERIVRRDFPAEQFPEIIAVLGEFDSPWESTRIRVRIAVLKLADGDVKALRKNVALANQDYRDILVLAEYPGYWRATSSVRSLPPTLSANERQDITDADWKQYQNWLHRCDSGRI